MDPNCLTLVEFLKKNVLKVDFSKKSTGNKKETQITQHAKTKGKIKKKGTTQVQTK